MKESATCRVFYQVMAEREQALCLYDGYRREFYPIVLGHTDGEEKVAGYQFDGSRAKAVAKG